MGLTHSMSVLSALLAGPGRFEHWPVERSRSKPCTQLATLRPFSVTQSYYSCTLGFRPFQTAKGIPGGRTLESQCVLVQVMFGAAMTIQDDFFLSSVIASCPPPTPKHDPSHRQEAAQLVSLSSLPGVSPQRPPGFYPWQYPGQPWEFPCHLYIPWPSSS